MRRHRCPWAGQAIVELALCVPVLATLVVGGILVAHFAHTRQLVVIAAQEGARVASAEGRTLGEGAEQAAALLSASLGRRAGRFSVTPGCVGGTGATCRGALTVAMRIRGDYPLRMPWGAALSIPIDVTVSMVKEGIHPGPYGDRAQDRR